MLGDIVSLFRLIVDVLTGCRAEKSKEDSPCFRLYQLWKALADLLRCSEELVKEVERFAPPFSGGYPENVKRVIEGLADDLSTVQHQLMLTSFLPIFKPSVASDLRALVDHKAWRLNIWATALNTYAESRGGESVMIPKEFRLSELESRDIIKGSKAASDPKHVIALVTEVSLENLDDVRQLLDDANTNIELYKLILDDLAAFIRENCEMAEMFPNYYHR